MTSSLAGRVRSASPSHHRGGALAIDMRRIANLLRDPPAGGGDNSINTSICSSPQSAWEPGDRGAAPIGSARNNARNMVMQHQFTVLAERVNSVVAGLQRQNEADRRRISQLERKLEARLEERNREGDGREKWAEIQGSVTGLIEETQALTRRVEGLDERLWARTSGSELTKQRNRELEQQVQALEQQARLGQSTLEDASKRQATKLRRAEHAVEEAQRRLAKLEEEVRVKQQGSHPRDGYLEARVGALEHQQERLDNDVRALQMHVDDGLQGTANMMPPDEGVVDEAGTGLEEAVHTTERGLVALEKKVSSQCEDLASSLASLRVKVDGQLQRVGTLAERIETAHEPATESMRAELLQARQQDRREVEGELSALRSRLQEATEGSDEAMVEVREALRQNSAQIAALSLRPEESPALHNFDERLAVQEQEVCDLRARLDSMPGMDEEAYDAMGGRGPEDELEDVRRRLEWLEEQGSVGAAGARVDQRQGHDTICELVQSVSRLKQQASSSESAHSALLHQVQQLQGLIERRSKGEDTTSSRMPAEVEAKVAEMWEKVAELHARLLEVEGGLDFARSNEMGTLGEVSIISKDGSRVVPPLPHGEVEKERGEHDAGVGGATSSRDKSAVEMKEKLEAVAEHLEVVDELAERLEELERRAFNPDTGPLVSSPAKTSEVSFGGDAPIKADLHARIAASEQDVKALRECLSKQELTGQRLEASTEQLARQIDALTEGSSKDKIQQANAPISEDILLRLASSERELQSVRENVSKQETTRRRVDELEALVRKNEEEVSDNRKAAESSTAELERVIQRLQDSAGGGSGADLDKVFQEVDRLSADVHEAKDAVASLRSSAPVQEASLKELRRELADLRASGVGRGGAELPEQLAERLRTLEERVDSSVTPAAMSHAVDEKVRSQVHLKVQELTAKVEGELADLVGHQKELADTKVALDELLARSAGGEAATRQKESSHDAELAERLRVVEERLVEVAGASTHGAVVTPAADDASVREEVQEQVEALRSQVSEELCSLARFQDDLGSTRASLKALEDRDGSLDEQRRKAERSQKAALDALQSQVSDACQRLQIAEDATSTVKRELEQLQGTRKVGIGIGMGSDPGSPLAMVRKRLDTLSEQVADLQQTRGRNGRISVQGSQSPPRSPLLSRDASLNFSLTEQTERHAGDGSLNFSLTESKKDLSFSEPLAGPSGKRGGDSDSTGQSTSVSSHATSTSLDSKALASRLSELPELRGSGGRRGSGGSDVLDSLVGGKLGGRGGTLDPLGGGHGSGGDVLDSLVGGGSSSSGLGGRPRPSPLKLEIEERGTLAPVAEESSDVGEQSFESHRSRQHRTPLSTKSAVGLGHLESPSNSGSLDNSRSNLEVSVSCQEVSIGHDYSVEDSQELDKCDFVEVVKPKVSSKLPEVSGTQAEKSTIGIGSRKAQPMDALDADVLDSLLSKPRASATSSSSAAAVAPAKAEEEEDNEYAESFEENASVSESIQSGSGSRASNAWDDGEDV